MNQTQNIALDSCVVIDLMEKPKVASGMKASLRGKSIRIILCDVVLDEVRRVRGYLPEKIVARISKLLGRKILFSKVDEARISNAKSLSEQFHICHNGDNKILSLCQARDFVLVTFDRMLLKACSFVGVAAFHPAKLRGI